MQRRISFDKNHKEEAITQMIGVRADANDTIASGHIMRCITIAGELIAAGCKVLFFTADEHAGEILKNAGMQYVCLHTDWSHMEGEIHELRRQLLAAGCKKLIVDSYQVTEKYFRDLSDVCTLIYLDDCFERVYPVDMVVNYNAYHMRFPYEEAYADTAKLLLGTAYVPLREEFGDRAHDAALRGVPPLDGKNADSMADTHILLSSGGGDICNALVGILSEAMADETLRNMTYDVVVGRFNGNGEELAALVKAHSNIRIHEHVDYMARLMQGCTAAVSAAGTTLYELCAMRVPTVFFACADNQQYDCEFFSSEERMLCAGDIRSDRERCLKRICGNLKRILEDEEMRKKMKEKLGEVTDGKGARRIAEEIIRLKKIDTAGINVYEV